MPFKIVRNDITKVKADVIVNTANPNPICVSGTDLAIYEAAGKEKLLAERANIGKIARGDIAVTGAYNLKAKYIIHTVGPVWHGGMNNEDQLLTNAYNNSLRLAVENGAKTVAFPNISTGVYCFPKERAARIAIEAVRKFLKSDKTLNEVVFVCFDRENYEIYERLLK